MPISVAYYWLKDPDKWSWIGWRNRYCRYFQSDPLPAVRKRRRFRNLPPRSQAKRWTNPCRVERRQMVPAARWGRHRSELPRRCATAVRAVMSEAPRSDPPTRLRLPFPRLYKPHRTGDRRCADASSVWDPKACLCTCSAATVRLWREFKQGVGSTAHGELFAQATRLSLVCEPGRATSLLGRRIMTSFGIG